MTTATQPLFRSNFHDSRESLSSQSLQGSDGASNHLTWLKGVLILAVIAAVGYADHLIVLPSLLYLYILPITLAGVFLREEISYALIVACILFHYFDSPHQIPSRLRIFHHLSALLCFTFVVYVIQFYANQQKLLLKGVEHQRDDLLKDVELAAQVQRLFLPASKPAIGGLEIAGMMHPAHGVGGDYYDYIPIDAHTTQFIIADVSGKGVPAALLMSATAAAMRLEADHGRNMLEQVRRLNAGIHAVSDSDRFVTLLLAEIDTRNRTLRYVNCGHNPALLFRAKTAASTLMDSSCPPLGLFSGETCELTSRELMPGDLLVFYTDGVTEAENRLHEEFGIERLVATVARGSSLSAEDLMENIYNDAADFCGDRFDDDVTILVVKCKFDPTGTVRP